MMDTDRQTTSRPAIRKDPLPQAGDSLQEQLFDQLIGKGFFWVIFAFVFVMWAALEWWRYLGQVPVTLGGAWTVTVMAAAVVGAAAYRFRRAFRKAHYLKQGIRGEIHVSQYLRDMCVPLGYRMFDDVPARGSGGGIQH